MCGNQKVTADFKLSSRSFPGAKLPKVMRRAFTSWEISADSPSLVSPALAWRPTKPSGRYIDFRWRNWKFGRLSGMTMFSLWGEVSRRKQCRNSNPHGPSRVAEGYASLSPQGTRALAAPESASWGGSAAPTSVEQVLLDGSKGEEVVAVCKGPRTGKQGPKTAW